MDSSSLLTYAGIGAAGSLIWSAWGYIKGFAQVFGALFVGSLKLADPVLRQIAWKTLGDRGFRLPQAAEICDMLIVYRKATGKKEPLLYMITTADRAVRERSWTIFWYKGLPLLLSISPGGSSNHADGISSWSLYYIRGLFNMQAFLDDVVAEGADWTTTLRDNPSPGQTVQAFRVIDMFGNLGSTPGISPDAPNETNARGSYAAMRDFELIAKGINRKHGITPITEYSVTKQYAKQYLDYLVYPEAIYSAIQQACTWKASREWYNARGIPWTLGWLLYGKPGTGKSALVKATAEKLDLPVYIFHLSTMSNRDFVGDWQKACQDAPAMVVFEDFDGVFTGRINNSKDTAHNVLSFDTVLNTLDGVAKNEGIFLVITTNHIDKIDEALGTIKDGKPITRPGRIDHILELTNMTEDCRRKIADRILCDFTQEDREALVMAAADTTAAQFTNMCINHVRQNKPKGDLV